MVRDKAELDFASSVIFKSGRTFINSNVFLSNQNIFIVNLKNTFPSRK